MVSSACLSSWGEASIAIAGDLAVTAHKGWLASYHKKVHVTLYVLLHYYMCTGKKPLSDNPNQGATKRSRSKRALPLGD